MRSDKARWDEKALHYSKYRGELSVFHQAVLDAALKNKVNFKDATLIDIGCGTGVFSLHFANELKCLIAQDISANMLAILKSSYEQLNASCELELAECDFADFRPLKYADIALSTLSPALNTLEDFAKFDQLAKVKIYASWSEHRRSSMLEGVFKKFGASNWKSVFDVCDEFLASKKVAKSAVKELRVIQRSEADALKECLWHLRINSLKEDEQWLKGYLKELSVDGYIKDEICTNSQIYIWQ